MKSLLFVCLVIGLTDITFVSSSRPAPRLTKNKFTDYLLHGGRRRLPYRHRAASFTLKKVETDDEDLTENIGGSGLGPERAQIPRGILDYFKEVPRSQWSCCMLGRLAGDKGFHCHAQLYRSGMSWRNRNRTHSKKRNFYGRYYAPMYGRTLVLTFQKCVSGRAMEFNKCCYAAASERREMHRWHMYHEYKVSRRG